MVALFIAGDFAIADRGLPDIQQWKVGSFKPNGHPAEKPIEGLEWLVRNSGPEGALVLDPFLGSGTTAMVAKRLGRRAVGIDLNAEYLEMAKRRCAQMSLLVDPSLGGAIAESGD